jgi:hypothetical protein
MKVGLSNRPDPCDRELWFRVGDEAFFPKKVTLFSTTEKGIFILGGRSAQVNGAARLAQSAV